MVDLPGLAGEAAPRLVAEIPDVDLTADDFQGDRVGSIDQLRTRTWIVRTMRGLEVLDYDVVREMAIDRRLDSIGPDYYEQQGASASILWYATEASLPMIAGERHDRIRAALQSGFSRRRIEALRPAMRDVAHRLIDRLADQDPFDLVSGFTHVYPLEVMCALMGIPPEDVERVCGWTVDLGLLARFPLQPHMARIDTAIEGLRGYFRELLDRRRTAPQDDFIGDLLAARGERALTDGEMEGALLNLLFAAHDTTRYQFGWVVWLLVTHDAWRAVAADRSLVRNAVDEAMRLEPALHIMLRKVLTEVEYRGLTLPAGSLVVLNISAANRDAVVFADPHRFDLERSNANRHLGFGHGWHLCLGHALARAEMAEALDAFLDHFADLRAAGDPRHEEGFSSMSGAEMIPLSPALRRPHGMKR